MNFRRFILLVTIFSLAGLTVRCQKVLIIEKPGNRVSFRYYIGDFIRVKLAGDSTITEGKINNLTDSTVLIGYNFEFRPAQIAVLYKSRWGFTLLSSVLILGGGAYLGVDIVNNVITGDRPVVRSGTAIVSGSMMAAGFVTGFLKYRKCLAAKKNWRVKILDLSSNNGIQ